MYRYNVLPSVRLILTVLLGAATSVGAGLVRVPSDTAGQFIEANNATVVATYDAFVLCEVAPGVTLQAAEGADDVDYMRSITLHAAPISTQARQVGAFSLSPAATGSRLGLVQFAGPLKPEWGLELMSYGLQVVHYVPHNAFLVYGPAASLDALDKAAIDQGHFQFIGAYLDAYKIHPRTLALQQALPQAPDRVEPFSIQLVNDKDANTATVALLDGIKQGPFKVDDEVLAYRNLVVSLRVADVAQVAARPDVVIIRPYVMPEKYGERQGTIVSGHLDGAGQPNGAGYLGWLTTRGFNQAQFTISGFAVDVTDSGIDNGTTSPGHFGLYEHGISAGASRVAYNRLFGSPNPGSTTQGCDGHGTLDAHVVAGFNAETTGVHLDSQGYRYGLGICPFVKVGSSVIFDPDVYTFPDFEDLISSAYNDSARISTDSWGSDVFGDYTESSQRYDALVRDAQPASASFSVPGNQEMVIVFAAGNAGEAGSGSVGSPGTAKNVITVGASENVQSHSDTNGGNNALGNDGCALGDLAADDARDIATFSSRGPCQDGRSKPEIVAPGTHVSGGVAQTSPPPDPSSVGDDLDCFTATGVCGLPGGGTPGNANNFFPLGQQFYSTSSGTSHATPGVAGGAALVRQYFLNKGLPAPSPAMTKAYLMNSARYLDGLSAGDDLWSNSQGMGLMDLGRAFDPVERVLRDQLGSDLFTGTGQERLITGLVDDPTEPVRITISWTDAPGATFGNAFNNDLDLEVQVAGQTYRGNNFNGEFSVPGGSADFRNNTESVVLPPGTTGAVAVVVRSANINSDGVPGNISFFDQDFALAVYNLVEAPVPVIVIDSTQIILEECGPPNESVDPSEDVTMTVWLRNAGTLTPADSLVAELLDTGGVVEPGAPQDYGILTAGGAAVPADFTFTGSGDCGDTLTLTFALTIGTEGQSPISLEIPVGTILTNIAVRTSTASIRIPGAGTQGPGSPYPSSLAVTGLEGKLLDVNLTLDGFSHTFPSDVSVVVESPSGETCALMALAGGASDVSNIDLTFDDEANQSLTSPLSSGTFVPGGSGALVDAPAPLPPYGSELSVFDETDPNGTWKLWVYDRFSVDTGIIASGWRLQLTVGEPTCCLTNIPPMIDFIPEQFLFLGDDYQLQVTAEEIDGDPVTMTVSNPPPGTVFETTDTSGLLTWDNAGPVGVYTSVFFATDKDGFDSQAVQFTVFPEPGDCAVLISEYVEGTGNNQAIEIFNGSTNTLDLAEYAVWFYFNGSRFPGTMIELSGQLEPRSTFVLARDIATQELLDLADLTEGGQWFNGNDFIELRGTNGPVDSIGTFEDNSTFAYNQTLSRGQDVLEGDTNAADGFDLTKWIQFDVDSFFGLGEHFMACFANPIPEPPFLLPVDDLAVGLGVTMTFPVRAIPTGGDPVTLSMIDQPPGSSLTGAGGNGTFEWSATAVSAIHTTVFVATDIDGSAMDTAVLRSIDIAGSNIWINEIHYDNQNIDVDEGVEIAGPAGTSLAGYSLVGYDGNTGQAYTNVDLAGAIDEEGCGLGALWFPIVGLENGPDAVALLDPASNLVQFLSYEGLVVGSEGPATSVQSLRLPVDQAVPGSTEATLQLTGTGVEVSDFTWTIPGVATRGMLNETNQVVDPCNPTGFLDTDGDGIPDFWEDEHFGGITNANPVDDGDDDGFNELEEWIADTNPTNDMSFFKITDITGDVTRVIFYRTSSNRQYTVQANPEPNDDAAWTNLAPPMMGSGGTDSVSDATSKPIDAYRGSVELP